jgi:hypothetical protein
LRLNIAEVRVVRAEMRRRLEGIVSRAVVVEEGEILVL